MLFETSITMYRQVGCFSDTCFFYQKKMDSEKPDIDIFVNQVRHLDNRKTGIQVHNRYSLIGLISWLFNCATYVKASGMYVNNSSMSKLMLRLYRAEVTQPNIFPNQDNVHLYEGIKIDQNDELTPKELAYMDRTFKDIISKNRDKTIKEIFKIVFDEVNGDEMTDGDGRGASHLNLLAD